MALTKEQVSERMFKLFEKWHIGQTCLVGPNDEELYYEHDVQRFEEAVVASYPNMAHKY